MDKINKTDNVCEKVEQQALFSIARGLQMEQSLWEIVASVKCNGLWTQQS